LIEVSLRFYLKFVQLWKMHAHLPNVSSPNEKTKFIYKVSCGLLSQVTNGRGGG